MSLYVYRQPVSNSIAQSLVDNKTREVEITINSYPSLDWFSFEVSPVRHCDLGFDIADESAFSNLDAPLPLHPHRLGFVDLMGLLKHQGLPVPKTVRKALTKEIYSGVGDDINFFDSEA